MKTVQGAVIRLSASFMPMRGSTVLPEAACFVFLFNPFDAAVMEKFLILNRDHFERFGSVIAYAYDVQREVFAAHGFEMVFRDEVAENFTACAPAR